MTTFRRETPSLDATDEAIIAMLHEDGRRPYGEIARAVGLSEAATRKRVNRLRDAGVLRIVALVHPLSLGRRVVAMLAIDVDGRSREVAQHLGRLAPVEYIVITAGSHDILAEVIAADMPQLLMLIDEHVRTIPGVRGVEVFVCFSIEKLVFNWGRRGPQPSAAPDPSARVELEPKSELGGAGSPGEGVAR
ncbi:Lrp/AsnC family transcriptional regulator [Actinomadura formosensis]|uniref:Lrp/AsnC family transcriptional regulator n=1 Tax=Actinomadura formosensis TaxID=60706 RepID=UPI003D8A69DE